MKNKIVEITNDIYYNQDTDEFHTFIDDEPLTKEDIFVVAKGERYKYVSEEDGWFIQQPIEDINSEPKISSNDLAGLETWIKQI